MKMLNQISAGSFKHRPEFITCNFIVIDRISSEIDQCFIIKQGHSSPVCTVINFFAICIIPPMPDDRVCVCSDSGVGRDAVDYQNCVIILQNKRDIQSAEKLLGIRIKKQNLVFCIVFPFA